MNDLRVRLINCLLINAIIFDSNDCNVNAELEERGRILIKMEFCTIYIQQIFYLLIY